MSRCLRKTAASSVAAVVIAATMVAGTAGLAGAQTTKATDRAHDKPSFIDLTKARFTYGDHRYVAKVHVRDLKWRGTFAFNFLINEADQAYGAVQLQAHRKSRRLSIWTGWYDRGVSQALKQCHPDVRFKPGRNVVRVSVPRNCFPWKPKGTQFIVESSGWKHDRFRFDDIDGSASYN